MNRPVLYFPFLLLGAVTHLVSYEGKLGSFSHVYSNSNYYFTMAQTRIHTQANASSCCVKMTRYKVSIMRAFKMTMQKIHMQYVMFTKKYSIFNPDYNKQNIYISNKPFP